MFFPMFYKGFYRDQTEDARPLEKKKPCNYKDLIDSQRIYENRKNNGGMEGGGNRIPTITYYFYLSFNSSLSGFPTNFPTLITSPYRSIYLLDRRPTLQVQCI